MDTNHAWETFDRFLRENVRTIFGPHASVESGELRGFTVHHLIATFDTGQSSCVAGELRGRPPRRHCHLDHAPPAAAPDRTRPQAEGDHTQLGASPVAIIVDEYSEVCDRLKTAVSLTDDNKYTLLDLLRLAREQPVRIVSAMTRPPLSANYPR
ncbi:hypothetical protein VXE65_20755 [Mycolicibacterium conceptionense]|uniref:hypothetical protein n=1 Tax=Mycolicibacterium conceptionense TaxID=451644 RepID=UPI0032049812